MMSPSLGSSPLARGTHHPRRGAVPAVRFIPARAGNTPTGTVTVRGVGVHPRSRGEHCSRGRGSISGCGSSPLARGTPGRGATCGGQCRFIPARAGNTSVSPRPNRRAPVHPRSRGEHARVAEDLPVRERFIPARAGNTPQPSPSYWWMPVHPRSRGEHALYAFHGQPDFGSSPLARGTPPRRLHPQGSQRFIPARAGNTDWPAAPKETASVHPRSRGEHPGAGCVTMDPGGSSPLARGTQPELVWLTDQIRFIPARAGNTSRTHAGTTQRAVHPRSRGEHFSWMLEVSEDNGSSPLARGTRVRPVPPKPDRRFIPARAGNTIPTSTLRSGCPVHPRSRGEHPFRFLRCASPIGSSPLARGTPDYPDVYLHSDRFIPARAGNT